MMEFKVEIYDIEEAFFKTLEAMTEDSEDKEMIQEAVKAFTDFAVYDGERYDFMTDFLSNHTMFYKSISEAHREVFELDAGFYYIHDSDF